MRVYLSALIISTALYGHVQSRLFQREILSLAILYISTSVMFFSLHGAREIDRNLRCGENKIRGGEHVFLYSTQSIRLKIS